MRLAYRRAAGFGAVLACLSGRPRFVQAQVGSKPVPDTTTPTDLALVGEIDDTTLLIAAALAIISVVLVALLMRQIAQNRALS